jgi:ribose 5-phosphate isomerase RpiB
MCGDFDDQERVDEELFDRFIEQIGRFGVIPAGSANGAPAQLDTEAVRAAYMEQLFKAGLTRCVNDAANLPYGERMDALAGQAIVFARLAGFLTAQFPPDADLFRTVTSALVDGHNEPPQHQH